MRCLSLLTLAWHLMCTTFYNESYLAPCTTSAKFSSHNNLCANDICSSAVFKLIFQWQHGQTGAGGYNVLLDYNFSYRNNCFFLRKEVILILNYSWLARFHQNWKGRTKLWQLQKIQGSRKADNHETLNQVFNSGVTKIVHKY